MARSVEMPNRQPNSDSHQDVHQDRAQVMGMVDDRLMEEILENMNTTPLGQVLKKIASLPGARQGKVMDIRRQITRGSYDVGDRLEAVVDRVLEDLTA